MCRNVQTTLGINLRPGPIRPRTHPNLLTAPQTKNGNNFLLLTSQKINTLLIFFLLLDGGACNMVNLGFTRFCWTFFACTCFKTYRTVEDNSSGLSCQQSSWLRSRSFSSSKRKTEITSFWSRLHGLQLMPIWRFPFCRSTSRKLRRRCRPSCRTDWRCWRPTSPVFEGISRIPPWIWTFPQDSVEGEGLTRPPADWTRSNRSVEGPGKQEMTA